MVYIFPKLLVDVLYGVDPATVPELNSRTFKILKETFPFCVRPIVTGRVLPPFNDNSISGCFFASRYVIIQSFISSVGLSQV